MFCCPHCLAIEGLIQKVHIDRPCPRCSYFGDWFGTAVYARAEIMSLQREAKIAASHLVEAVITEQERRPESLN